jgi:pimeloyl-ACP methyl ester carboxylesterase
MTATQTDRIMPADVITAPVHPEQPSDPPIRSATLEGRRVTWVESGPEHGPAIVLIHGLPGSHRDFRWLAPPLEAIGLRVIRLDMPGFGGSDRIDARLSSLAEHVLARLDQLALDRVVLLGHSFGGPQALLAASREPTRVVGLGLLASVGLRPHRALRSAKGLGLVRRALAIPGLKRPLMAQVRAGFHRAGFPKATPDAEIRRSIGIATQIEFRILQNAVTAIRVPTLLATCDDDRHVEPAIFEELGAALPDGPRLRFPDGGHNLQKTKACEIAEQLGPWALACLREAQNHANVPPWPVRY